LGEAVVDRDGAQPTLVFDGYGDVGTECRLANIPTLVEEPTLLVLRTTERGHAAFRSERSGTKVLHGLITRNVTGIHGSGGIKDGEEGRDLEHHFSGDDRIGGTKRKGLFGM
jgi:hypothetical protein